MRTAKTMAGSKIGQLIVIMLGVTLCGSAPGFGQQSSVDSRSGVSSQSLPDVPKPMVSTGVGNETANEKPEISLLPSEQQAAPTASSGTGNSAQQQAPSKPVGTAAAPPEGEAGITASRPAGAVIAPAKQRRARAILIRVGLLVGAGVALGTVLLLTHATPNQPPK